MTPTKNPDPAYLPVASLDIGSRKNLLIFNLIGFAMLFVFGWLFYQAAASLRSETMMPSSFILLGGPELLALVVGLIGVLVLHELVHGIFFRIFTGDQFELGIRPFYAFAASPDWYFPRGQFTVIGLAPVVLITLLGFGLMAFVPAAAASVILVSLVVNAAGSVADLVVVSWVLLGARRRLVRDTGPLMIIYEPAQDDIAALSKRWLDLATRFGLKDAEARWVFADLIDHYSDSGRYYHNVEHVEIVLDTVASLKEQAEAYDVLQLAAWFHDIVYEPLRKDNEARSAEYARETLLKLGISEEISSRVAALILITADHVPPGDDIDAQILVDADLAPLGADKAQFAKQSAAIRQEFSHVPENDYRQSRLIFLNGMLERERLFNTEQLYAALENRARDNLHQALADLG